MYSDDRIEECIHHNAHNDLICGASFAHIKNKSFLYLQLEEGVHTFEILALSMESVKISKTQTIKETTPFEKRMRNRLYKLKLY